jgi:hypothetical protein
MIKHFDGGLVKQLLVQSALVQLNQLSKGPQPSVHPAEQVLPSVKIPMLPEGLPPYICEMVSLFNFNFFIKKFVYKGLF